MPEGAPVQPNNQKTEGKEELKLRVAHLSVQSEIVSPRHKENQDTALIDEANRTFGVLDGMGGERGGKTASEMGRDYISKRLHEVDDVPEGEKGKTVDAAARILSEIFIGADESIKAVGDKDEKLMGMGTTATVVKFFKDLEGKEHVLVPSVGNSRAYKISKFGVVKQINQEDDFFTNHNVQAMFGFSEDDEEKIKKQIENAKTKEELAGLAEVAFSQRNVIGQCLGHGKAVPHVDIESVEKGDIIVIVSDLYDNFSNQGFIDLMQELITSSGNIENAAKMIIERTQEVSRDKKKNFRAKSDDMTVVIVEVY